MQYSLSIALSVSLAVSWPVFAQSTAACKAMTNDTERLACWDALGAQPPPSPQPKPAGTPTSRAQYADTIRRAFLSSGIDIDATDLERQPESRTAESFKKYPRLWLFGYMNKPFVYRAITEWQFLAKAKERGFQSIEFFDKGPDGIWLFDISGSSIPACDIPKRICM